MLGGSGLQDGGPGGSTPQLWIEEGTDSLDMRLVSFQLFASLIFKRQKVGTTQGTSAMTETLDNFCSYQINSWYEKVYYKEYLIQHTYQI